MTGLSIIGHFPRPYIFYANFIFSRNLVKPMSLQIQHDHRGTAFRAYDYLTCNSHLHYSHPATEA